uniref:Reverse transcriptase zinc-binding domain-containing protein n=1 Tax=Setaria viridis TaxID=4556 RepID=A0A4V6D8M3_SETVI|nr:hypothetical protein SEVIR_4G247000v2 [Setaria viridis]
MNLDSYACELCILQCKETVGYLFFRCNFAEACWNSIGVTYITTRPVLRIIRQIRDRLAVPFFMEVIILMLWSISTIRNDWMFNSVDPSIQKCKDNFSSEFALVLHRARSSMLQAVEDWLNAL